jgi:hypothetical protein
MKLYHYIYVSEATQSFTHEELDHLGNQSAAANKEVALSGLLLHANGHFMQLLEGDKYYVNYFIDIISKDTRHKYFTKVLEGPTTKRLFPQWSMGVVNLDAKGRRNIINDAKVLAEFIAMTRTGCVSKNSISALRYFRARLNDPEHRGEGVTDPVKTA